MASLRVRWGALVVLGCFLGGISPAHAFKIGSAISPPCHELITLKAFFGQGPNGERGVLPMSFEGGDSGEREATWLSVAQYLEKELKGEEFEFENDFERFVGITLFIGVRYPDQAGFAITDVNSLRMIHLEEEGQEAHALRAEGHDGEVGNTEAVAMIKEYILGQVDEAREVFRESLDEHGKMSKQLLGIQSEQVAFWLDFYGQIPVRVWMPIFILGRAAHALQDSFTHTYRSEDLSEVYAVGNFVEAIGSHFDEDRDGPRHSDTLDDCTLPEVEPLYTGAVTATHELFVATRGYFGVSDITDGEEEVAKKKKAVEDVLDKWLKFKEGCGADTDYCDSPWAILAKRGETHPLLGCRSHSGLSLGLLVLALGAYLIRRRRLPS